MKGLLYENIFFTWSVRSRVKGIIGVWDNSSSQHQEVSLLYLVESFLYATQNDPRFVSINTHIHARPTLTVALANNP